MKNLTEVATLKIIDSSYVSRMVNLTTQAPDIVEAILKDEQPDYLTLFDLAMDTALSWGAQRGRVTKVTMVAAGPGNACFGTSSTLAADLCVFFIKFDIFYK